MIEKFILGVFASIPTYDQYINSALDYAKKVKEGKIDNIGGTELIVPGRNFNKENIGFWLKIQDGLERIIPRHDIAMQFPKILNYPAARQIDLILWICGRNIRVCINDELDN